MTQKTLTIFLLCGISSIFSSSADALDEKATVLLEHFCFDCHEEGTEKGGLNLSELLTREDFDGALIFENLLTGKMPPSKKEQPDAEEKRAVLDWLVKRQKERSPKSTSTHTADDGLKPPSRP